MYQVALVFTLFSLVSINIIYEIVIHPVYAQFCGWECVFKNYLTLTSSGTTFAFTLNAIPSSKYLVVNSVRHFTYIIQFRFAYSAHLFTIYYNAMVERYNYSLYLLTAAAAATAVLTWLNLNVIFPYFFLCALFVEKILYIL